MTRRPPILSDPTFQVLTGAPGEITVLLGGDGEILYVSPGLREVLGLAPEEKTGQPSLQEVHPDDRERVGAMLADLVSTPGSSARIEYRVRHADGSWRVLDTSARNLLEDERVGAVLLRSRDVTRGRELLARVGRTERYLEQVVSYAPVTFYLLDPEGTILLSEGKGLETLGFEPGELVGRSVFDLYPGRTDIAEVIERALTGEETKAETEVGGRVVETLLTPHTDDEGRVLGVSGVSFDRTEEVRAREADAFKARLLDAVGQAVIVTDPEGRITYWNRAATDLYGWERDEVMGRPAIEVTSAEELREEASGIFARLQAGETWSGELTVRRKDGTAFPVLVTGAPILDDAGNLVGVIGVSVDLTERKELEARLQKARRSEAIGRLAGGVAHDFNNLLTAIRGYVRLLLDEVPGGDRRLRPDLEEIDRTARRAADLTAQLLAYSRRQVSTPRRLDLADVVDGLSAVLDRVVGDGIGLTVEAAGPSVVEIDPSQLDQVLVSLARNARDSMPGGGEMEIRVGPAAVDEATLRELGCDEDADGWVELTVRDTGTGIASDDLPHVFEPFYAARLGREGSGLALATVYGIVTQHGGCVRVASEPGRSTTFHVYLPGAAEAASPDGFDAEEGAGVAVGGGDQHNEPPGVG